MRLCNVEARKMNVRNALRIFASTYALRRSEEERIAESFAEFGEGWGALGEGKPIPRSVIDRAILLIRAAGSLGLAVEVHPGYGGEVLVSVFKDSTIAEFYVEENQIEFVLEQSSVEVEETTLNSVREAEELIRKMGEDVCLTFEFWTQKFTTLEGEGPSSALHFSPAARSEGAVSWEYQYSAISAKPAFPKASASI